MVRRAPERRQRAEERQLELGARPPGEEALIDRGARALRTVGEAVQIPFAARAIGNCSAAQHVGVQVVVEEVPRAQHGQRQDDGERGHDPGQPRVLREA